MSRPISVAALPGDGIGPEVTEAALAVLDHLARRGRLALEVHRAPFGGEAIRTHGHPFPESTRALVAKASCVLLGAVGDPSLEHRGPSPESGLLELRRELAVFANLRPIRVVRPDLGPLRPERVEGCDLIIVRELTGGIYFGEPRGRHQQDRAWRAFDTMTYAEHEIERVARIGFELAQGRRRKLCSVDKANVLETSRLWREVVGRVAADYPEVELDHMLVDAAAMHLITRPRSFDVLLTANLFGDILSDEASVLLGSIGLAPSASLGAAGPDGRRRALYEPIHGSAPDIAGQGRANPLGAIASLVGLLRYTAEAPELARQLQRAIDQVLLEGPWTADLTPPGSDPVGTLEVTAAVIARLDAENEGDPP